MPYFENYEMKLNSDISESTEPHNPFRFMLMKHINENKKLFFTEEEINPITESSAIRKTHTPGQS